MSAQSVHTEGREGLLIKLSNFDGPSEAKRYFLLEHRRSARFTEIVFLRDGISQRTSRAPRSRTGAQQHYQSIFTPAPPSPSCTTSCLRPCGLAHGSFTLDQFKVPLGGAHVNGRFPGGISLPFASSHSATSTPERLALLHPGHRTHQKTRANERHHISHIRSNSSPTNGDSDSASRHTIQFFTQELLRPSVVLPAGAHFARWSSSSEHTVFASPLCTLHILFFCVALAIASVLLFWSHRFSRLPGLPSSWCELPVLCFIFFSLDFNFLLSSLQVADSLS